MPSCMNGNGGLATPPSVQYLLTKKNVNKIVATIKWKIKRNSVQIGLIFSLRRLNKITEANIVPRNKNAGKTIVDIYGLTSNKPAIRPSPQASISVNKTNRSTFSAAIMTLFLLDVEISTMVNGKKMRMNAHKDKEYWKPKYQSANKATP